MLFFPSVCSSFRFVLFFFKCNFPIKMTSREENRLWHCTKRQVSSDFWLFEWAAAQPAEVQGRANARLALQQLWQKNYRENVESFLEFSFLDIWFHWKITFFRFVCFLLLCWRFFIYLVVSFHCIRSWNGNKTEEVGWWELGGMREREPT